MPAPTPASVEEACALLDTKRMNAVVNEKGCEDEVDIDAGQSAVLQDLVDIFINIKDTKEHLRTARIEANTGNAMIYKCLPCFVGVAFVFYLYVSRWFSWSAKRCTSSSTKTQ